jgi:GTP pyrophosphokinase
VPGRFKDYVSTPKQNGYRSLHTTIVGPRHQRVELQIRTTRMHHIAEYGVAAHVLYKDKVPPPGTGNGASAPAALDPTKDGPYVWLRRLVDTLLEGDNPEEFLEHTKLELFQDQVFCFTPKGRLIALPRGATPIDFAYAVHTDVGNRCVGANINGRQMPLTTQLRNGDEVHILTSASQTPPAAWERIAVTGKARSAIRRAARDVLRRQYAELGRRLLVSAFAKIGHDYTDDKLRKALFRLSQKTVEDVHAAVGRSELAVADVVRAVAPDAVVAPQAKGPRQRNRHERTGSDEGWFNLSKVMGLKFRWPGSGTEDGPKTGQGVPIRGMKNDVPVRFEDGGAVPGDRIVGVLTPGEGIRIFQIHSPRLKDFEHERWIDVTWDVDPDNPERFPAQINVTVLNEPGTLAQIAQVIGEEDGNIDNLRMVRRGSDFTDMQIEIEVWDLEHLNRIVHGLRSKPAVSKVERIFD